MRNQCALFILAFLPGCSNSGLDHAVKDHQMHVGSAEIRHITYSDAGNYACVEAYQNRHSGGTGRSESYYQKNKGEWAYIRDFDETHSECVQLINILDRRVRK